MCWGPDFCCGCHLSPWALLGESSALQFDFEILSTSTERPIFPPKRHPSVWWKSVATLNVLLPLLNICCISFEIKSTNGAGLRLFASSPAKSVSCVVVILYGCVCISTFKLIRNHWFYMSLWCCNVSSIWFGSWLLLTSVLGKERGVKIDGRTHSYNKVAVTDEEEFFCSAVKICKVRKRMAAGF